MRYTKQEIREHRLKWVEALESGKYEQGTHRLRDDSDNYCCLGVACDISGLGNWSKPGRYRVGDMHSSTVLPPAVSEWLGARSGEPWLGDLTATFLNDVRRWDFKKIAARARKVWGL